MNSEERKQIDALAGKLIGNNFTDVLGISPEIDDLRAMSLGDLYHLSKLFDTAADARAQAAAYLAGSMAARGV